MSSSHSEGTSCSQTAYILSHAPSRDLNPIEFLLINNNTTSYRGGSRGRVQGVRTTPPEMTCGFLIQLVFCKEKKTMWFIGVEVEQETSAPPPKKNPGSAPELVCLSSSWRSTIISSSSDKTAQTLQLATSAPEQNTRSCERRCPSTSCQITNKIERSIATTFTKTESKLTLPLTTSQLNLRQRKVKTNTREEVTNQKMETASRLLFLPSICSPSRTTCRPGW